MATGDHKGPHGRVKADPPPRNTSRVGKRISSKDVHKDAWTGVHQDPTTYLTTQQLAADLGAWATNLDDGHKILYTESIYRWCKKWFGQLPEGRSGPGMGYRIPLNYRYVARVWYLTEHPETRATATAAILADGENPKSWVVVVANLGSTHYTVAEVAGRVHALLPMARQRNRMVHAFYVGDERNPDNG